MRTRQRKWLTDILSIVVAAVALASCPIALCVAPYGFLYFLGPSFMACEESYSEPTNLPANIGHFKLPPSTKNLEIYFGPSMWSKIHCSNYIRFEIEPSDVDVLLSSIRDRIKLPLSIRKKWIMSTNIPQKLGWDVDRISSYLSGASTGFHDYSQAILIDTSNSERYIVYAITDYED